MRLALPSAPGLDCVLAALPRARLVGGCVRDQLAGRPIADIDLATPTPPAVTLEALAAAGLRAIPTGLAHGTITAISDGHPYEITSLRHDVATDGRHAEVAWTEDFAADAGRRDFTINAMSLDAEGTLYDYFGGQADLAAGRIRFVGPAATRIAEDYLRILRYFRFFARYGLAPPDSEAASAIAGAADRMGMLSAERVWHEIKGLLATPDPGPALALMERLGVRRIVLPEAGNVARLHSLIEAGGPVDPLLRLASLLEGSPQALTARLKFAGHERERLIALGEGPVPAAGDDDLSLTRMLADDAPDMLIDRAWLASPAEAGGLAVRLRTLPRPVFPLQGRHALALGAVPGPNIGAALARVRGWWLEGGCVAGEVACLERLREEMT